MWSKGALRWFWRWRGNHQPEPLDGDTLWAYFVVCLFLLVALADCAAHGRFN